MFQKLEKIEAGIEKVRGKFEERLPVIPIEEKRGFVDWVPFIGIGLVIWLVIFLVFIQVLSDFPGNNDIYNLIVGASGSILATGVVYLGE